MALTILNNISSMTAQNALSNTQANLQKTLTQLSTGLKINSGSDDAAGLSIAMGMNANISALTQSQQNANNGIGMLQTADGALSQVTTLLNRAVTLATEGATAGITSSQSAALNTEFQSIKAEIDQIGQATNFNGSNVFSSNAPDEYTSTQGSASLPLTTSTLLSANSVTTISDSKTGGTFVFTSSASGSAISALKTAIDNAVTAGTLSAGISLNINASSGKLEIGPNSTSTPITVSTNDAVLGPMNATPATSAYTSVAGSTGTPLTASTVFASGDSVSIQYSNGNTATYTASAATTLGNLVTAINTGTGTGFTVGGSAAPTGAAATAAINSNGKFEVDTTNGAAISVTSASNAVGGGINAVAPTSTNSATVYLGDGTTTGVSNTTITTSINSLSSTALSLNLDNLSNSASAIASLANVTAAINSVSAQRGVIGASVNRLTAANSVMANQITNLQSAANGLSNADIGKTVANMTQYNVLQSTGMAALQQSNQAQQAVLKLVQ